MIVDRVIGLGDTVRITDAVWGEVTEIINNPDGEASVLVIKVSDVSTYSMPIEELPPQVLDA